MKEELANALVTLLTQQGIEAEALPRVDVFPAEGPDRDLWTVVILGGSVASLVLGE